MRYRIDFTKQAQADIDFHRKAGNKAILKKINTLLEELVEHPFTGTGKPEALKFECKHSTKYNGIDHPWFLNEAGVRVTMSLIFVSGTFLKNQYKYSYGFISCDLQLVNTV
jgi:toxin YoeB